MADVQERVTQLLAQKFNMSESDINSETAFVDLTDSFGLAELAAAMETEFNCELKDEEAYAIENVGGLVSYLSARIG